MEQIKFSVLMSVYKNDKATYVKEAIDSIINQTYKPNEIIIVVDGPVPSDIENILIEYKVNYNYIKIVPLENNSGLGEALRVGMQFCSNEIIARMDSDDVSLKNRFEIQLNELLSDSDLSVVGSYQEEFIEDINNVIGLREVPIDDYEIKKYIKKRCPMNHVTTMFRKSHVEKAGGYLHYPYNEDFYLWIRMVINKCKFKTLINH